MQIFFSASLTNTQTDDYELLSVDAIKAKLKFGFEFEYEYL